MLIMRYEDFLKYVGFSVVENNPEKRFFEFAEDLGDGYTERWVFDAFTGFKFRYWDAVFKSERERGYIGYVNPDLYTWYTDNYANKAKEDKKALLHCWGDWPIVCGLARTIYAKPENFGEFVNVVKWIDGKECEKEGIPKDTPKEIEELARTALAFGFEEVIKALYEWDKEEAFDFPTTAAGYYLTVCVSIYDWLKEKGIFEEMCKYSWK